MVFASCLVFGQGFSGAISGSVRDASGAVIPQATVSARHVETGQTRVTETGANGNYNLAALPVGPYELTVEKPGFRQLVRRGITLAVSQEAVVNLTLEVGQVQQTVEVTGEAPLVNTTLASTSGLIGEDEIKDLPLNGRSFHQLMTLNSGTVDNRTNSGAGQASFSIDGKRTENNRWTINGVDYVGNNSTGQFIAPSGMSGQLLGVEAVREFNVLGHTYGAEYGKRSGGQVTVVTTTGTNQLHGTAFEYLRNSSLDARNYFDDVQAPLRRNQFGGSLGGPIVRDKMFMFGNYEGYRQRLGESSNEFVPNLEARQGRLPCNVIQEDPRYRSLDCGGPGNYVTVPNLQQGMLPYLNLFYPTPNGPEQFADGLPTGVASASSNPSHATGEDFGLARFDFNVSNSDSLASSFTADQGRDSDPDDNTNFLGADTRDLYTLSVQETHIFSPTVLNVATFGHTRARAESSSVPIGSVSIPENLNFLTGENRNSPGAIVIGGSATAAQASALVSPNPQNPFYNSRKFYSGSDDLTITVGRHNLKMGAWFQRVQQIAFSSAQQNAGTVSYPTLLALLQDQPTTFGFQANPTELNFSSWEGALYFQDEIKVKPNLTVRIGLRDEFTNGWNEANGHSSNYDYDANGVIETDPFIGTSPFRENNAKSLWQPRVGVAWDPGGTGKWAVRAGFGIHNDLQDNLTHRLNSNQPFAARVAIESTPVLSLIPITGGTAKPSCSATLSEDCLIYAPGGLDPRMHTPTILEWSLEIQRELASDFAVELSYVGSESYYVATGIDMNTHRPEICDNPAGCLAGGRLARRFRTTVPQGTQYIPVGGRANPFVGSTQTWMFFGTASHQGGSISLTKRARGGLMFKTNYTISKVLDLDSGLLTTSAQNEPATVLNPYDLRSSRGLASFSVEHAYNASFSYQMPFAQGAGGWKEKVLGGWQWNGILTWQGGFPLTPQVGSNRSGNGDSRNPDRPDRNPDFNGEVVLGVDGFKKSPEGRYFDPDAFSLPTAGTFGNIARGAFRGPGMFNVDTSLFKRIPLNESWNLQFRAEFFNILNHANFDAPNPLMFSGTNRSATAGVITETIPGNERQIQFALKLEF